MGKTILIAAALIAASSASAGPIRHDFNACMAKSMSDYMACTGSKQECDVAHADEIDGCSDKARADRQTHPENW